MPHTYPTKPIADITINQRHRKDLGDVAALAASIKDVGLLHPVVINPDGVLIAGARRIAAAKELGWDEVPVTIVDLDEIVRGEYAENTHREPFRPTKIDAIRRALEPREKAAAKQRQRAHGSTAPGKHSGKISRSDADRTRDKIGDFAGKSGRTVEKIALVMDEAKAHPNKFGHLPEQMDRTGKVEAAFREVTGRTNTDAPIRMDPHDRFRHDQNRLAALYVKDAAKYQEYREIGAHITKQVNDQAERKQLFPDVADKPDRSSDRAGRAEVEVTVPITNAPPVVPEDYAQPTAADEFDRIVGDMPEFLRRKQELSAALKMPYLRNDPEKLEALVLARIS